MRILKHTHAMRQMMFVAVATFVALCASTLLIALPRAEAAATHTVTSVSPASGSGAGGEIITISGTNFVGGMTVRVDGFSATNVVVQNSTTIIAQTPVGVSGLVSVSVVNASNESVVLYDAYTYTDAGGISLSNVTPSSGPETGGTAVTLQGSGFTGFVPFSSIKAAPAGNFTCGIAAGAAYCWGINTDGRLGDGTGISRKTPAPVLQEAGLLAGKTVTSVSVGSSHACAIADGEAYCWGNNGNGQLGDGSTTGRQKPVKVAQLANRLLGKTVTTISAGLTSTCAVADGEAFCWGSNASGQIGDTSETGANRTVPSKVMSTGVLLNKTVTSISTVNAHTCAIADGQAFCWGINTNGRLGNNSTTQSFVPVQVAQVSGNLLGKTVTYIAVGTHHSCAVADGEAFCWGANNNAQIGDGSSTQRTTPIRVAQDANGLLNKTVTSIVGSTQYTCAIASGEAYCWGTNNTNGRLGNGTTSGSSTPTRVNAGNAFFERKVSEIAVGPGYTCALMRQSVYCVGDNTNGEFGVATPTGSITPIMMSLQDGAVPLELTFGAQATAILSQSSSQLTATTPANTSGAKDVSLRRTDTNQTVTLTNGYQYVGSPTLSSISPSSGAMAGGDTVVLTGTNFVNGATVSFGANAATSVTYISDTQIKAVVPAATVSGPVTITVINPDAQQAQIANGYTYLPPAPTLSSVNAPRGKMGGGNTVQLTGTNFVSSTNPTVTFDGVAATNVTVINSTTISLTVPASATVKRATITYTDSYGQSASLANNYTYLPQSYIFTNPQRTLSATEPGEFTVLARNVNDDPVTIEDQISLDLHSSTNFGYFALTLDESNGDPWDATTLTFLPGESSATFFYKDTAKGSPTLTVSDAASTSATQVVTIGSRYRFQVTGVSDPVAAGVPSSVTVRAVNYLGQPETSYTGTVHFSSNDIAAHVPKDFTMTADMKGVRTFVNGVMFGTAGEYCVSVVDVDDETISGEQCSIDVTPPPAGTIARLRFITPEQGIAAGKASSAITVQAQDITGAPVAVGQDVEIYIDSQSSTADFSEDGVSGWSNAKPYVATIAAGTTAATFYYRDSTLGAVQLRAADLVSDTDVIDNGLENHTQNIMVGVGEPSQISIDASNLVVHRPDMITIGLADDAGNLVTVLEDTPLRVSITNGQATVSATSGGASETLPYTAVIPAGANSVSFYVTATEIGEVALAVDDARVETELPTVAKTLNVIAAEPFAVRFAPAGDITVRTPAELQVQLYDEYGNITPAVTSTVVSLATSSPGGEFRATANGSVITSRTIAQGATGATVHYYGTEVGSHSLASTSVGLSGSTAVVEVVPDVPHSLIITTPASQLVAGVARQFEFEVRDVNGFVTELPANRSFNLTRTASGEFSLDGNTWGATSLTLSAGQSSGSFYYRSTLAGPDVIRIADGGNALSAQRTQSVVAAAPRELVITSTPQTITRNATSAAIQFAFKDVYGNQTAADSSTVISLSDNSGAGEFAATSGGPWTTNPTITVPNNALSQSLYYRTSEAGSWQVSASAPGYQGVSQGITVIAGFASKLQLSLTQVSAPAGYIQPVTVTSLTEDDIAAPVLANTSLTLSSTNGGEYSESESPFIPITSSVMSSGTSTKTLYYRAKTVGSATLTVSATGMQSEAQVLSVTPDEVYRFVVDPPEQDVEITKRSGSYVVMAQDVYGNVSSVTVSTNAYLYSDSDTGDFVGQGGDTVHAAIAPGASATSFTYRDTALHEQPVQLTVSDKATLDNPDLDIQNGQASANIVGLTPGRLEFETAQQSIVAGERSQIITVSLLTGDGQPAYQDGSMSLSLAGGNSGLFYASDDDEAPSIASIVVPRGESSVSFYYKATAAGEHTVRVGAADGASATQTITVAPDEADRMNIVSAPQRVEAGTASGQIIAKIYDQYMNETTVDSDMTAALTSSCVTGQFSTMGGTSWQEITELEVSAGSDQLAFYYKDTQAALCTLTVSSAQLGSTTQQLEISGSTATQLQMTIADTSLEVGQSTNIAVRVTDVYGNVVPVAVATDLFLRSSSNTAAYTPASLRLLPGQSQANASYRDTVTGSATLTIADQPGEDEAFGSLIDATGVITVVRGAPASVSLTAPASGRVGEAQSLTVRVLNEYDEEVPATQDVTVRLQSTGAGQFSSTQNGPAITQVVIPSGDSQVTLYYVQSASGAVTLSAEDVDENLQSASAQIVFGSGNVVRMEIQGDLDTAQLTGEFKQRTVTFYDTYGNIAALDVPLQIYLDDASAPGNFYATPATSQPITRISVPAGSSSISFYYHSNEEGSATLTVRDDASAAGDSGIQNDSQVVTVSYGQPAGVKISQTGFSIVRGEAYGPLTVSLVNAAGGVIPAPEDIELTLQATGGGEFAANLNDSWESAPERVIAAGEGTITTYLRNRTGATAITYGITATAQTDNGQLAATANYTVIYGAAAQLAFTSPPQTITATHPSAAITVELRNAYGAPIPSSQEQRVYLRSSQSGSEFAATSNGPWAVNFVTIPAGLSTTTAYYRSSHSGTHTITAADSLPLTPDAGLVNAVQAITVNKQEVDHFYVANISDPQKAGTPTSVVVVAQDDQDYTVADYDGTIEFTSDDPSAVLPASYTFKPAEDKGSKTFVNAVAFRTMGEKVVTVTDVHGITGQQRDITVTAANTAPIRAVKFTDPTEPYELPVNRVSQPITIQPVDDVGEPTTGAGIAYPVRLTASSATGEFSTNAAGPWSRELITTVPAGLTWTTVYYRDTTPGDQSILVSDWIANTDNGAIDNDALIIAVRDHVITNETSTSSQSATGRQQANRYLFAHNESGAIHGRISSQLYARHVPGGGAYAADWSISTQQGGQVVDAVQLQGVSQVEYELETLATNAGANDYHVAVQAAAADHADATTNITVPVSAWKLTSQASWSNGSPVTLTAAVGREGSSGLPATVEFIIYESGDMTKPLRSVIASATEAGVVSRNLTARSLGEGTYSVLTRLTNATGDILAEDLSPALTVGGESLPVIPGVITTPDAGNAATEQPSTASPSVPAPLRPSTSRPAHAPESKASSPIVKAFRTIAESPYTPFVVPLLFLVGLGWFIGLVIVQILRQIQYAAALKRLLARDKQTSADKQQFMNLIAHHLRTPVTVIGGAVELLLALPDTKDVASKVAVHSAALSEAANNLVHSINERVQLLPDEQRKLSSVHIYRLPSFWLSAGIGVGVLLAVNWLVVQVGRQSVDASTQLAQVLLVGSGLLLLYMVLQERSNRQRLTELRQHELHRRDQLDDAKNHAIVAIAEQLETVLEACETAAKPLIGSTSPGVKQLQSGLAQVRHIVTTMHSITAVHSARPTSQSIIVKQHLLDEALAELDDIATKQLTVEQHITVPNITTDPVLLKTVIASLLDNAAAYSPDGGKITITTAQAHGGTSIVVADEGPGMPDDVAKGVLAPFTHPGDEMSETHQGLGLSLYLDALIMRHLGGELMLKSGHSGAVVELFIPGSDDR